MGYDKRPFDPMNEPEQCPCCHDHPDWLEIAENIFQCQNCYAILNTEGKILEEPAQDDSEE